MNPFGPSFVEPQPPLYALSQGERPLALGTQPDQLIFWLELHGIAGAEAPAPILQQTRAVLAMVCGAATATARKIPCSLAARNDTSEPFRRAVRVDARCVGAHRSERTMRAHEHRIAAMVQFAVTRNDPAP